MIVYVFEGDPPLRHVLRGTPHSGIPHSGSPPLRPIYTQVSIRKLKEIHTATHPAKMRPNRPENDNGLSKNESEG